MDWKNSFIGRVSYIISGSVGFVSHTGLTRARRFLGGREREIEREKGAVRYDIMSAANPRRAKDVNDCGFSGTGLSLSLCSLSILCYLSLSFSKYSEIIKKRVINSTAVLEATGPLSIYLYIFFFLFFLYLHFFSLALFLYIHLYLSIGIYISLYLFYLAVF